MSFHASWVHGHAVTVENPENLSRWATLGWGAEVDILPGKASWFHIAVPTPVIVQDGRTKLQKCFLLFKSELGTIRNVHVWDGGVGKILELNGLSLEGDHHAALDGVNTFVIPNPQPVAFGIGISFFVQAADTAQPSHFTLSTAGGDFIT